MYYRAEKLFYLLMAFILLNVFFLSSPNNHKVIADFQADISARVARAFTQTIGTDPWGREIGHIYTYTYNFYTQAADSYIALVSLPDVDKQMADIAAQTFDIFKYVIAQEKPLVDEYAVVGLPKEIFMQIPPLENIVPMNHVSLKENKFPTGQARNTDQKDSVIPDFDPGSTTISLDSRFRGNDSGGEVSANYPLPATSYSGSVLGVYTDPWVNVQDPISGKFYCVAIYGGEINKYEGKCVKEYY
jgi:hypothetical protein